MNPLVSVIIPVYKTEKYLEACVLSVINQTYKNLQIILVDDGSPDNSSAICDRLSVQYDNISVIHKKNGGLSDARNEGTKKADGEFLLYLDSDDTLVENAIELMVNKIIEDDSDAVYPDRYYKVYENSGKKKLCYHFPKKLMYNNPVEFGKNVLIEKCCAWRSHSLLYRTKIIIDNNVVFPIGYTGEDVVFNLHFFKYATKISFITNVTVNYLKRSGSITSTYNPNFFNTIIFIDSIAEKFLIDTDNTDSETIAKLDSMFMRMSIVYMKDIMSEKNKLDDHEKKKQFMDIINNERFKQAQHSKLAKPFFSNRFAKYFFIIMYFLIRRKLYKLAMFTTKSASIF